MTNGHPGLTIPSLQTNQEMTREKDDDDDDDDEEDDEEQEVEGCALNCSPTCLLLPVDPWIGCRGCALHNSSWLPLIDPAASVPRREVAATAGEETAAAAGDATAAAATGEAAGGSEAPTPGGDAAAEL